MRDLHVFGRCRAEVPRSDGIGREVERRFGLKLASDDDELRSILPQARQSLMSENLAEHLPQYCRTAGAPADRRLRQPTAFEPLAKPETSKHAAHNECQQTISANRCKIRERLQSLER
nr:hypothetical protein [Croceibacterium sp. D39]